MPRPLKIFAPGRELGSDSTRPMTRLAEHSRGADLCCSSPLEDRGSATTICVHAQYGGYARQRVMRSSQAMARCMADRHGGSHGRCPGSRDCPPADDTFALPRYRGDMAAVRPIMTGDEWAAAHVGRSPTPDDVTITLDGRRIDSKEKAIEWLAEIEADRAAGKTAADTLA